MDGFQGGRLWGLVCLLTSHHFLKCEMGWTEYLPASSSGFCFEDLNEKETHLTVDSSAQLTISGYTDQLSIPAGDKISFHISTGAPRYDVEIARVGAERQVMWSRRGLCGTEHPVPADASTHGCRWPVAFELVIPRDWPSGYYSVILRAAHRHQQAVGEISFVVRSLYPGRDSKILLQRTTNTDCAYNSWGGSTFYNGPSRPAQRLSFDRPYAGFDEDGLYLFDVSKHLKDVLDQRIVSDELKSEFLEKGRIEVLPATFIQMAETGNRWYIVVPGVTYTAKLEGEKIKIYDGMTTWESGWRNWEKPFVEWAERAGYQMDYAVNTDLEFSPEILQHYRLVLSVGHDEYWSSAMRDHLESFIGDGGNVAFFSANSVYWQVRSEDNGRALVCYKIPEEDPLYADGSQSLLTTVFCHHLVNRPENYLTGVSFAYGGYHDFFDQYRDGEGAYTVHRPDHWIFSGTGLKRGDKLGVRHKLIGYECDGCEFEWRDGLPVPTHADGTPDTFEILATAPAALTEADDSLQILGTALYGEGNAKRLKQPGAAVMGIYQRGGTVFTSGCTEWTNGLRGGDEMVEQITRNILDRLSQ